MEQDFGYYFSSPLLSVLSIIIIIIYLLHVAAEWKILVKAGEKGWKALIPLYNIFVSHHIVGMSHIWFVLEVITWVTEIALELIDGIPNSVVLTFGILTEILTVISAVIHIIKLCRCFGKGTGFKIGMLLLPTPFALIIAFGKAEYKSPHTTHKHEKDND